MVSVRWRADTIYVKEGKWVRAKVISWPVYIFPKGVNRD
tara:strand:- start:1154 stop:1270 length:117 start_codon:yes stop_codon:yes gene_type:complete